MIKDTQLEKIAYLYSFGNRLSGFDLFRSIQYRVRITFKQIKTKADQNEVNYIPYTVYSVCMLRVIE